MMTNPTSPAWGEDSLSKYLDTAASNVRATWARMLPIVGRLRWIDEVYGRVVDNLTKPDPILPSFFIPMAHSAFRAAVGLGTAGQVPEAYMVMRGCIETSTYALHVARDK
jgi:hypothetical protein